MIQHMSTFSTGQAVNTSKQFAAAQTLDVFGAGKFSRGSQCLKGAMTGSMRSVIHMVIYVFFDLHF